MNKQTKENFDVSTAEGQMRLIRKSVGQPEVFEPIQIKAGEDYGCDPLGNGMFKMVPSGKIVNKEEKEQILRGK